MRYGTLYFKLWRNTRLTWKTKKEKRQRQRQRQKRWDVCIILLHFVVFRCICNYCNFSSENLVLNQTVSCMINLSYLISVFTPPFCLGLYWCVGRNFLLVTPVSVLLHSCGARKFAICNAWQSYRKRKEKKKENTLIYALEGVAHCFVVAFAVCRSNLAALRSNLIAKSSILVWKKRGTGKTRLKTL